MDANFYRYFKAAADMRSFSKAAELLFVSQPSLSQAIKKIEAEEGVALFKRTASGIVLTEAGKHYYQMASQILKLQEQFRESVSAYSTLQSGSLNVATTAPLMTAISYYLLPSFLTKYPDVHIDLGNSNTKELKEQLLSGKLDFAIFHTVPGESISPALETNILATTPFLIVAQKDSGLMDRAYTIPGHPHPFLDPKELKDSQWILTKEGQRSTHITRNVFQKAKLVDVQPRYVFSSHIGAAALAAAGLGVAILPAEYIMPRVNPSNADIFCLPPDYDAAWNIVIAKNKGTAPTNLTTTFEEAVSESIKDYCAAISDYITQA